MSVPITRITAHPPDPATVARWTSVVTHTHNLRSGQVPFPDAKRQLVDWCSRHGVGALGVGSPWEPVSAASYQRYEGPDRDLYYSGRIDPTTVMDREAVEGLIADLNRARPQTLFYLDNETPKARHGHLWWFGWHYDAPAWHDYSQDRPISYHDDDPERELNALTGEPHRRRAYLDVVAAQRARGALAVWAHPTSWWTHQDAFVTNIAAELPLHLVADGRLDGLAVMGYDAFHRHYQELWWSLLDTGAVVPGFAETDSCFDRANLANDEVVLTNRLALDAPPTLAAIVAAARAGRGFATSGPFLHLAVDGAEMGAVVDSARGSTHRVRITAHPAPGEHALGRVDLIGRGGAVLASVGPFAGGTIELMVDGGDEPAWLVARAVGERDDPQTPNQKEIRHCALTNPVYLRPRGVTPAPAMTDYRLDVRGDSPWLGGTLTIEDAAGAVLESGVVVAGAVLRRLPASARITLGTCGRRRTFSLAMENPALQARLRYLWGGGFRRDFPDATPGAVPAAAFQLDGVRAALATARYAI